MTSQRMRKTDREQSGSIPRISTPATGGVSQLWRIVARIVWACLILLGLFSIGVLGFYLIGGVRASWSDAVYMTLITISTVGYGEIVPLNTFGARLFAGVMSIAGLGVLTFLFYQPDGFFS